MAIISCGEGRNSIAVASQNDEATGNYGKRISEVN